MKMNEFLENITSIAEALGWSVDVDKNDKDSTEFYVDFRQSSPAGEDFGETVWLDEKDSFSEQVSKIAAQFNEFDIDEHIEMWIEAKKNGVSGVPSCRDLVHDAEDIYDMLEELGDALVAISIVNPPDESVQALFPDWNTIVCGKWSEHGRELVCSDGSKIEIGLYREPLKDDDEDEYAGTLTLHIFDGDDVILCKTVN